MDTTAKRIGRRPRGVALLMAFVLALALAPGVGSGAHAQGERDFEIWALDQGTNTIHIHNKVFAETHRIELDGLVRTPHMIDFDSEYRYAFVASTGTGDVTVIRAADRQVVDVIPTGATAHMAAVTPDDSAVWVANIGAGTLTEIEVDLDAERFTLGDEIHVASDPLFVEQADAFPSPPPGPVCHQYTPDSRYAYLTLGPAVGGLVVVDLQEGELVRVFDPAEVKANCGTYAAADGTKMYANWGTATQDEGEWYVFDTATHELVHTAGSRGVDAHGVRLAPDGRHLWMVNRASSNGVVIDTTTDEVVRELPWVGQSPDFVDFSPDGRLVVVSLRGPEPRSGPHAIAGDTPGFAVLNGHTGRVNRVVQPAGDDPASDFHGIAVRPLPRGERHGPGTRPQIIAPHGFERGGFAPALPHRH